MSPTTIEQDQTVGEAAIDALLETCKIDDLYDQDFIVAWVKECSAPDDVFDDAELGKWAEKNGWTREQG